MLPCQAALFSYKSIFKDNANTFEKVIETSFVKNTEWNGDRPYEKVIVKRTGGSPFNTKKGRAESACFQAHFLQLTACFENVVQARQLSV